APRPRSRRPRRQQGSRLELPDPPRPRARPLDGQGRPAHRRGPDRAFGVVAVTRAQRNSRAGVTLIEVIFAVAILVTLLAGIVPMLGAGSRGFEVTSVNTHVDDQVVEVLDKITRRLRASKLATMAPVQSPPFSSNRIDFQRSTDFAGGAAVWSPTERIVLTN